MVPLTDLTQKSTFKRDRIEKDLTPNSQSRQQVYVA